MKTVNNHQVADQVLTASTLISMFLKDKLVRDFAKLDTTIGDIKVTYEVKDHAPTGYGLMFKADIEMFDEDVEEFLPYTQQWFLDLVQVMEWATNQEKFDSYRVKP